MNNTLKSAGLFFILIYLGFICLAGEVKPLKIGDKVPDIEFKLVDSKTGGISKGKLSDYKGKLVIIDFWASWCYSCLHKFPKMDELQKKYSNAKCC